MNFTFRWISIPQVLIALLLMVVLALTSCAGNQQNQVPAVNFEQPSSISYQHKCEGADAAPCTPQEYIKESFRVGSSLIEKLNSGTGETRELASRYYRTYSLQNLVVLQLARKDAQALAELESFLLPELPADLLAYTSSEIYNVPEVRFQGGFGDPFAQYSVNGNYFTPVTLGQAQLDFNTELAEEIIDELGDAFEASLRNRRHSYRGHGNTNYSPTNGNVRRTNEYIRVTNAPVTAPSTPTAATQATNNRVRAVVVPPTQVAPRNTPTSAPGRSPQPNASATPAAKPSIVPSSQPNVPRASQAQTSGTQVNTSAVQFGSTDRRQSPGGGTSIRQSNRSRPAVSSGGRRR